LLQLKERKKEDHMFENKEVFVTSAYRKKLEEEAMWKKEQRIRWVGAAV
jgi:coiled-coil domain-containing protein 55